MKRLLKEKITVAAAVAAIALSVFGSNVSAAELNAFAVCPGGDFLNDNPQTAEEQYQEMVVDSTVSEEELQKFYEKVFMTPQIQRADIKMKVLTVPYCKQETNHYCGPATAQQTLKYLAGSAESQDNIWEYVREPGTTATNGNQLRDYINARQDVVDYVLRRPQSSSEMISQIYNTLDKGAPAILWLQVTKGGNWIYSTSRGHFMNASGINTGGSLVEVTDPWIGWIDGDNYASGKYWVTAEEVYSATTARGMGNYCY